MSYPYSSEFDFGLGTSDYNASDAYTNFPPVHSSASGGFIQAFYWLTFAISIVMAIMSCGTISLWFYGDFSALSTAHHESVDAFFGIAWVTLLLALTMFAMSIYALVHGVGFSDQLKKAINSKLKPDEYDTKYRLNELRSQVGQEPDFSSNGQSNLGGDMGGGANMNALMAENNPYPGVL